MKNLNHILNFLNNGLESFLKIISAKSHENQNLFVENALKTEWQEIKELKN